MCDGSNFEESNASITSIDSSIEGTSLPQESQVSISVFGDSNCGEPLEPQRLVLDFTPSEVVDNDFVQRKCCAFWDYISERTDLNSMMVLPEPEVFTETNSTDKLDHLRVFTDFWPKETAEKAKTAVSMLEFVEGKGLIDRIFEAKMKQSQCSLGDREYLENETTKPVPKKEKKICSCSGSCKFCRNVVKQSQGIKEAKRSRPEVQKMCKKLQDWDSKHPKSMDPPGHPPALSHSVMQRNRVIF